MANLAALSRNLARLTSLKATVFVPSGAMTSSVAPWSQSRSISRQLLSVFAESTVAEKNAFSLIAGATRCHCAEFNLDATGILFARLKMAVRNSVMAFRGMPRWLPKSRHPWQFA